VERRLQDELTVLTSAEVVSTMRRALTSSSRAGVSATGSGSKQFLVSAEPLRRSGTKRPQAAETLLAVSKVVGSNLGLAEVLRATTREVARAVRADIGSVWRLEPSERTVNPVAGYRVPKELRGAISSPLAFTQLLTAAQRRSGAPVYSSNSARKGRFDHPFLKLVPHQSVLLQPFHVKGQLAGVFVLVWTRARHRFTSVELRLVEAIGQQAGMAIENAELLASLQQFSVELDRHVADRTAQLKLAYDELRHSREELRALSLHLQQVREQERTRISREIHDELGQALTALKMDLAQLVTDTHDVHPGAPARPESLARAIPMVDHMIASVRRIATELRPQILDDLGLLPALEWQAQDFGTRTGITCGFRCTGTPAGLDAERSTALFRTVQETLTNVARHAKATHAQIHLRFGRRAVALDVRDNGRGMRGPRTNGSGRTELRTGLGLIGMRERAAAFGGTLTIHSTPHTGTRVQVRIPLPTTVVPSGAVDGVNHAGHHRVRRPSSRASRTGANHSERSRRRAD
jgi:signal transduction histidine kinase